MNKKILAVALATIMIAGCFAGCKKQEKMKIHGKEYIPVTNEDGEYIFDKENYIAVYETEPNGKIKKDENGEKVTAYVEMKNEDVSKGSYYESACYKLTMPEDWTKKVLEDGEEDNNELEFVKADNEKMRFKINGHSDLTEKWTVEEYIKIQTDFIDGMNKDPEKLNGKIDYKVTERDPIGTKNLRCTELLMKSYDTNGTLLAEQKLYFIVNGDMMARFSYTCEDVNEIDKFDVYRFIEENVVFKDIQEKPTETTTVAQ